MKTDGSSRRLSAVSCRHCVLSSEPTLLKVVESSVVRIGERGLNDHDRHNDEDQRVLNRRRARSRPGQIAESSCQQMYHNPTHKISRSICTTHLLPTLWHNAARS